MNIKLPLIIAIFIALFATGLNASNLNNVKTGVFSFTDTRGYFQTIDNDFTDLDPRDQNNQPLKFQSQNNELKAIFSSGLYELLITEDIHSIARTLDILREKLNPSAQVFKKKVFLIINAVIDILLTTKRYNFLNILICLSGLFFLSMSKRSLVFCSLHFMSSSNKSLFVLRC